MAVLATDDFNRANTTGPDLGANWTNVGAPFFADNGYQIVSNTAQPTTFGSDKLEYYSGASFPANQYSQAKVTVTGTTGGTGLGVSVRSSSAGTCYRVVVSKAVANNVVVGRVIAGVFATIDAFTATWVDGDVLKLEAQGTRLRVFQNGVQLDIDFFDTNIASGQPGIAYSSTTTAGSLDDWEGGTLSSAGDDPPQRILGYGSC